eukprot:jgi/Botrbrau1/10948/Bobra.0383s0004.2
MDVGSRTSCALSPSLWTVGRLLPEGSPCSVSVTFSARLRNKSTHIVTATLTGEGHRVFTLDGKQKTGKEIKEVLRAHGLGVQHNTIRQAQVNLLADSTTSSKERLASIVRDASGFSRWEAEASTALNEIKQTKAALMSINGNIQTMEACLAESESNLTAWARVEVLDVEMRDIQEGMLCNMQKWQIYIKSGMGRCAREVELLQDKILEFNAHEEELEKELQSLHFPHTDSATEAPILSVRKEIAAEEEEIKYLKEELDQAQKRLEHTRALAKEIDGKRAEKERTERNLHQKQVALQQARVAYNTSCAGRSVREMLEKEICDLSSSLHSSDAHLKELQREQVATEAALKDADMAADRLKCEIRHKEEAQASNTAALFELQRLLHLSKAHLETLSAQWVSQHQELSLALSRLGAWKDTPPVPSVFLHSTFRFKHPESPLMKDLCLALDIVAGVQP